MRHGRAKRRWIGGALALGALRERWSAGIDRWDYLERVEFGDEHRGSIVQGDSQLVRVDERFTDALRGDDAVDLTPDGDDAAPRRLRFVLDRGECCFSQPGAGRDHRVCCGERVRFAPAPIPGASTDFYRACAPTR